MASPGAQAIPLGYSFSHPAIWEKRSSAHLQCCLSSHGRAWYPTPIPDTCPFGGHESSWISQFGREALSNSKRRPCCLLWSLLWPPRPLRMDINVIWEWSPKLGQGFWWTCPLPSLQEKFPQRMSHWDSLSMGRHTRL